MQVEQNGFANLPLSQVVARFGNIDNFKEVMEKNGYILIKNEYITWFYVVQILSDDKVLLRSENLKDFVVPPRFI